MKIEIVTGPIRTGKTTGLKERLKMLNAGGVLSPVIDGKRYFLNVLTEQIWPMETEANKDGKGYLKVGRFQFSGEAFQKAHQTIVEHLSKGLDYLVIDEIGPLELTGKGLDTALKMILHLAPSIVLILVVRESLVDDVVTNYQLQNYTVIKKT